MGLNQKKNIFTKPLILLNHYTTFWGNSINIFVKGSKEERDVYVKTRQKNKGHREPILT